MEQTAIIDALWAGVCCGQLDGETFPALTLERGQQLNLALLARHERGGERVGGWKLGLTSGQSRDAFGAGVRPFGHILASRIFATGTTLSQYPGMRLENELCFTLAEPLTGHDIDAETARAAVATVAPAFELNQMRIRGAADQGLRVADNLSQWGIVVGPETHITSAPALDTIEVTLTLDGREVDHVSARGHIDDHFGSIARLARELAVYDRGLEPGDRVITGAYTRHQAAAGCWQGTFGERLGIVEVMLT